MTIPTVPGPTDSVRVTDFPAHIGGCAVCSEDLDYGCSAIPVHRRYIQEDCWGDYLTLMFSSSTPTAAP